MDVDGAIVRAAQMMAGEMYEEAMREYSAAFDSAPKDERVHNGVALALIMLDKPLDSLKVLGLAMVNNLGAAWPHGIVGAIMEEQELYDQAVESYDEVIKRDPSCAPAYVRKARILQDRGLHAECANTMAECARAARLDGEPPRAVERLREMFEDAGAGRPPRFVAKDDATFVPGLRDMLDIVVGERIPFGENSPYALSLSGFDERAEGLEFADEMLRLKPDSAENWCEKGVILADGGRADEAMACYERAIELAPGVIVPYAEKAILLQDAGDRAGMKECLRAAIGAEPDGPINVEMQRGLRAWLEIMSKNSTKRFKNVHNAEAIRMHIARRLAPGAGAPQPMREPLPQMRPPPPGTPEGRMFPPGLLDGANQSGEFKAGKPRRARLRAGRRR